MRIAIDAGHGPNTPGNRCPDGSMREFRFNSAVAGYVADILGGMGGMETRLTCAADSLRDVPPAERVGTANDWKADVFVSIHANSFGNDWNDANGIETFTALGCSPVSRQLACTLQTHLAAATGRRDRGVKAAEFYVLRRTLMPAVLVKCGFMTNRAEAQLLKSDEYRRSCADAIVKALTETFNRKRQVSSPCYRVHADKTRTDQVAEQVGRYGVDWRIGKTR